MTMTICFRLLSITLLSLGASALAEPTRVYFGTYTGGEGGSRGIYTGLFDTATGEMGEARLAAETVNPSFLAIHPDGELLFAVNEVHHGPGRGNASVVAYRIGEDGELTQINEQASGGGTACHCVVDATGRFLLVANYTGGNVAVVPIAADGTLSEASCVIDHEGSSVNPRRQRQPHAHSINLSRDNRFAYVADLGIDQVRVYRFDDTVGQLSPTDPGFVAVPAGGGPRHFSLHPGGEWAYSNLELTSAVTGFRRDPDTGGLTLLNTWPTIPDAFDASNNTTAECVVHPTGRFLYVSNRGHDSIAVFRIDESSGQLGLVEVTPSGGRTPRNFCIDPTGKWLLSANQESDSIVVYRIDPDEGRLAATGHRIGVGRPVCIRFVPASG